MAVLGTVGATRVVMGLVGVTIAPAACRMWVWINYGPAIGPSRLLLGDEAVVVGGLGSLWFERMEPANNQRRDCNATCPRNG